MHIKDLVPRSEYHQAQHVAEAEAIITIYYYYYLHACSSKDSFSPQVRLPAFWSLV